MAIVSRIGFPEKLSEQSDIQHQMPDGKLFLNHILVSETLTQ